MTWARIPHFYSTPYYVYQYATCFASSAQLMKQLTERQRPPIARAAIDRYLTLLEVRRQRSSDAAAAARRRRSQQAGDRARRRRAARPLVTQLEEAIAKLS